MCPPARAAATLADPVTGYQIYYGGQVQVVGGTSAVAPLWSALITRLAQATGTRFGLLQPLLYANISPGTDVTGFRDITSGSNGAYSAGPSSLVILLLCATSTSRRPLMGLAAQRDHPPVWTWPVAGRDKSADGRGMSACVPGYGGRRTRPRCPPLAAALSRGRRSARPTWTALRCRR